MIIFSVNYDTLMKEIIFIVQNKSFAANYKYCNFFLLRWDEELSPQWYYVKH